MPGNWQTSKNAAENGAENGPAKGTSNLLAVTMHTNQYRFSCDSPAWALVTNAHVCELVRQREVSARLPAKH